MVNKGGASHIEMIFSFVFFLGFVFFLFLTLKPYNPDVLPEALLDGAVKKFEQDFSSELFKVSFSVSGVTGSCFSLPLPLGYEGKQSIVMDSSNNLYLSDTSDAAGGSLHVDGGDGTYTVLFSEDFIAYSFTCTDVVSPLIGSVIERTLLSQAKLDLVEETQRFGIPEIYDFQIRRDGALFAYSNPVAPSGVSVYSQDLTAEVFDEEGRIGVSTFNFRIW